MPKKVSNSKAVSLVEENGVFVIQLNAPVTFRLPNTASNKKFLIVFLRLLIGSDGDRVCTFGKIAGLLSYFDRRNVNNFWREFESHGGDVLAY